jgi:hypothetical protein
MARGAVDASVHAPAAMTMLRTIIRRTTVMGTVVSTGESNRFTFSLEMAHAQALAAIVDGAIAGVVEVVATRADARDHRGGVGATA